MVSSQVRNTHTQVSSAEYTEGFEQHNKRLEKILGRNHGSMFSPQGFLSLRISKSFPKVCTQLLSHVQLFVTPWTVAHQAPLFMEFSSQEYWSRLPFPSPGDLPNPGIEATSPTLQADSLPFEPPGKLLFRVLEKSQMNLLAQPVHVEATISRMAPGPWFRLR